MKTPVCFSGLLLAASALFGQSTLPGKPVVLPDLSCALHRSGNSIVVSILNHPDARECPASTASITIGGVTQNFTVPKLAPDALYDKSFPIPATLVASPIVVTSKVDVDQKYPESNEGNNTCSETVNRPDLEPVLFRDAAILKTRSDGTYLYFSIKNTGDGPAPASKAIFTFHLANSQRQPIAVATPAIPSGGTVELRVSPNTCSSTPAGGDCVWDLKIDVDNVARESDETNNTATGGTEG